MDKAKIIYEKIYGLHIFYKLSIDGVIYEVSEMIRDDGSHYSVSNNGKNIKNEIINTLNDLLYGNF